MNDRLAEILEHKRQEVQKLRAERNLASLRDALAQAPETRGFEQALRRRVESGQTAVIAEMKRASPSQGLLRADFDAAAIADEYEQSGAACISVLTDEHYFHGSVADLRAVREVCALPVLRKDFIMDPWQVYETRLMGADCILLIAAALAEQTLQSLCTLALDCGLDVLLEVHTEAELQQAIATPASLIGINSRNLRTFETDLDTALELAPRVPAERLVIAESGVRGSGDVKRLREAGIGACLVGETLMRAASPGARLRELFA